MIPFKKLKYFCLLFLFWFLNACISTINLDHRVLNTAIVNEYYEYNFHVDHGWSDWWDESDYMAMTGGNLPSGMGVDSRGIIFGTPTELGNYRFDVTVYDVDRDFFGSGDVDSGDEEEFIFFVTEASTNPDCPHPTDDLIQEFYLCLGNAVLDNPTVGDEVVVDVNYYVYLPKSTTYDADILDFEIHYNPDAFEVNANAFTSVALREAATRSNSTVSFDISVPGIVIVHVESQENGFRRAGRFMDLPFTVKEGIVAGDYAFELTINSLTSSSYNKDLPASYALDGNVSVSIDEPEETPEDTPEEG
ncbi:Ig domain-containing protein [bacterium]|nr:Ig domain-containing protein [bacterium]